MKTRNNLSHKSAGKPIKEPKPRSNNMKEFNSAVVRAWTVIKFKLGKHMHILSSMIVTESCPCNQ